MSKIISWFSAGATSTVACKIALNEYKDVAVYYIDTGSHHPDNERYLKQCEDWMGCKINVIKSEKYNNVIDVIEKIKFVNSPYGASCTLKLKKEVRYKLQDELVEWDGQVWGFEYSRHEMLRAKRLVEQHPDLKPLFPLIERKITKQECLAMLGKANIEIPQMYKIGYNNNNCIGCVKGGMGYWSKIKIDFPDQFDRMAKLERKLNATCLKNKYLDELKPDEGNFPMEIIPECGLFCELEFMKL